MIDRLDIELLRTLKAVQDCGGVTKAAERLALTQSAVSHKIRRFEQTIGCELLRRRPGGLFTEDGERLLAYAEKIIPLHDEALLGINRPELNGTISLGVTEELVTSGLAEILGRFSRLYPNVKVRTYVEQSLILEQRLQQNQLDMAVMQIFSHEIRPTDEVIQQESLVWLKSRDYNFSTDTQVPFIAFDQNCFYRQWAAQALAGSGKRLDVVLECASIAGVCSAVMSGMGTALLAERHFGSGMEVVDLPQPPEIAFALRTGPTEPLPHLEALQTEIVSSLS